MVCINRHHSDDPSYTFPEDFARLMHRFQIGGNGEKCATGKVKMINHWTLTEGSGIFASPG